MAHAIEAPASTTAEGPTPHTQNQAGHLTAPQLRLLHRPVDPKRIGKDNKNFAHMEAWDIKRYLLRVFGFGGYDTENRELALVREIENNGRWTVVYRAQVRLTVKDVHGREIGHWDGEAVGDSYNQPKIGDAHDMAMKTASSQALKRAATNLGDQFGLSLYNNGSPNAVVGFCAAHPPTEWEKAAEPVPEPNDPPVQGEQQETREPEVVAARQEAAEAVPADQTPAQPETAPAGPKPPSEHLTKLMNQATACWKVSGVLTQIKGDGEAHGVLDEEFSARNGTVTTLRKVLDDRIAELHQQRSAA
ncbi:Rad52/Rad22 family DNA repair protein [Streptomyces sp. NPDC056982]|uniref:Rad52/Rad22 family DNA repair protein n=1 Tax=Streptomyces sp. NPDC056982 TaxID=3345986 RepID=UPI003629716C